MAMAIEKEKENYQILATKFDLKTRICIMASFIYGTSDQEKMTPKKAVELAVEIENESERITKKLKFENPIPRRKSI